MEFNLFGYSVAVTKQPSAWQNKLISKATKKGIKKGYNLNQKIGRVKAIRLVPHCYDDPNCNKGEFEYSSDYISTLTSALRFVNKYWYDGLD